MTNHRKTLGCIGLGAFGTFMCKHLHPYYRLLGYDVRVPDADRFDSETAGMIRLAGLADVASADLVVFAVPLDALEEVAAEAAPFIKPGALVVDVTSVKERPVEILGRLIPKRADLLGSHPLFGPQSGRNGIAGMRIALCPVRIDPERYGRVCDFLSERLRLQVLRTDPTSHDKEMAKVQAMTHFMSRALREIGLAPSPMATKAYEKLQEFASIVLSDSWDLFLTIEQGNPYAEDLRRRLLDEMIKLENKLKADENVAGHALTA